MDFYCERIGVGVLGEPLNTLSNVAFLLTAWCAWRLARRVDSISAANGLLIVLVVLIAAGSAIYHMFATPWARLLDVAPIFFFQVCYLWVYGRRLAKFPLPALLAIIAAFFAAIDFADRFPAILNGSLNYAPALVLLTVLGCYHLVSGKRGASLMLSATGLFGLSLVCRTIDRAICASVPTGSHFLWHLLNGLVLYLVLWALFLNTPKSPGFARTVG